MSLELKGLSASDIRNYYYGSYLVYKDTLFKVGSYDSKLFTGHILVNGVWEPVTAKGAELSIKYPEQGYVQLKNKVGILTHRIRRTRRKGFTDECFSIKELSGAPISMMSSSVLGSTLSVPKLMYEDAVKRPHARDDSGVALSRNLCLYRVGKELNVLLRGVHLGVIDKTLRLKREHEVFSQELREYNVPLEVK